MQKIFFTLAILILAIHAHSQTNKWYTTSAGEIVFSFASVDNNGNESGNIMRFSPVFNFQNLLNYDVYEYVGIFTGLNLRNIGFIYDEPNTNIRKKYRSYNIGVPIGIKFGNMSGGFLYGGYEIEFPINYKEKTFENEKKTDKFNVWFSNRQPAYYHTVQVGIQFKGGTNLKFKYYLTGFFNKKFKETINSAEIKPFENFDVNVFYVSLNYNLFKNSKFNNPVKANKVSEVY
ncbi:MAG: hypothetical protein Q8S18_13800 [Bacteroidales bacterium]|nr:hypothetical protein [Bacteroidales bacterium]